MSFESIFVTVGTTQFPELINALTDPEIIRVIKKVGCKSLTLQIGRGEEPKFDESLTQGIRIKTFELKASIASDIATADLVISHAGAGSCIEILGAQKPLLVVVNESLMENHQRELAEQLHREGYLNFCTPSTLAEALITFDKSTLRRYEAGNAKKFVNELDKFMGFQD